MCVCVCVCELRVISHSFLEQKEILSQSSKRTKMILCLSVCLSVCLSLSLYIYIYMRVCVCVCKLNCDYSQYYCYLKVHGAEGNIATISDAGEK